MTEQTTADLNSRALNRAHALAEHWQGDQTPITRAHASNMLMEVIQLRGWTQTTVEPARHLTTVRDAARTASGQQPETTPCACPHPVDEHSVYGCADDCACEWMPKRAARQTTRQDACACTHPQDRHLSACTECPCVGYASTWPPKATGSEGPDPCSACPTFPCRKCAPAVGQPAEAQAADPWTPGNLHFLRFALGCAAAVMYSEDDFTDEDHAALDQLRAFAGPEPSRVKADALDEAADEAERENHDCSSLARCQPCAVRSAVAAKLRRMAEEARS